MKWSAAVILIVHLLFSQPILGQQTACEIDFSYPHQFSQTKELKWDTIFSRYDICLVLYAESSWISATENYYLLGTRNNNWEAIAVKIIRGFGKKPDSIAKIETKADNKKCSELFYNACSEGVFKGYKIPEKPIHSLITKEGSIVSPVIADASMFNLLLNQSGTTKLIQSYAPERYRDFLSKYGKQDLLLNSFIEFTNSYMKLFIDSTVRTEIQ